MAPLTEDVAALLPAVAAYGLPGTQRSLPDAALDGDGWRRLLAGVTAQRLTGLLAAAVVDEAFPTTPDQRAEVAAAHAAAMATVLRLERVLLETVAVFEDAGIDHRVLKGSGLAQSAYPDPAWRVFGDVDLLVPSDQFDAAVAALSTAGYTRRWPQLRPGFDRQFGKGATFETPDGFEMDLHRTFAVGPFGLTVDLPSLFAQSTTFVVGGRPVRALAATPRFLLACYHAALGNAEPRLLPLRDVAQLLLTQELDTADVMATMRKWGGEAVVARAVALTWEALQLGDVVSMSVWAERYEPTRRQQRALEAYRRSAHSFSGKALASLHVIEGTRAKAAFLRALLIPDRAAISPYERGYRGWWRRGGRALLARTGKA